MSFLHPALLGLGALAAIPIVLHLMMRPKPKIVMFPALRLIESRRRSNVRRMRLRHLWLLLLRIAVILLLVLAVARPLVPAANYAFTDAEWIRLIAIAVGGLLVYFMVARWWAGRVGRSEYLYRRTVARGATGLLTALAVLALVAWPYGRRITAEVTNPNELAPSMDRPVAAVFLFDTSPSMEYQLQGRTRLERAKEIARDHLATFPPGSRVAIGTSADSEALIFPADLAAARQRIEDLQTLPRSHAMEQTIRQGIDLQQSDRERGLGELASLPEDQQRDRFVRGVYLFTDLARSSWTGTSVQTLRQRLEQDTWLQLFVVDVGVEDPINVGFAQAQPSLEMATPDTPLEVRVDLLATGGEPRDATVEMYVNTGERMVKQGQQTVQARTGQATSVAFPIASVNEYLTQGEIRLVHGDPFEPDNVRYFTIAREVPPRVLVVSDVATERELWTLALQARGYDVRGVDAGQFAQATLGEFSAVYLLNMSDPTAEDWNRLDEYVRGGGGLGVILGTRVAPLAYGSEEAARVLPAKLLAPVDFDPPELLRPLDDGHPVFARFKSWGGYGWLVQRDVRRYYVVEPDAQAVVVAAYSDATKLRPALVLQTQGAGRVALLTTGVDTRQSWSDLPVAEWQYMAFADQLTLFISGRLGEKRNFLVGETAAIRLPDGPRPGQLLLGTPELEQRSLDVPADGNRVTIPDLEQVGSYTLRTPPDAEVTYRGGFSANIPTEESDFEKLPTSQLDELLGEDRYQIAQDADHLEIVVRDTTMGAEFMPYVLIFLVLVFCGEQLVSNHFYDDEVSDRSDTARRS